MPSKAFVADQSPGAKAIHNNQRSEMVALALPAGKYALFASGTVEGSARRSVLASVGLQPPDHPFRGGGSMWDPAPLTKSQSCSTGLNGLADLFAPNSTMRPAIPSY
jgi:hypothetical protein